MTDLTTAFAGLVRHHTATLAQPLPTLTAGITWIWAANGIFKRGANQRLVALICTDPRPQTPGLAHLLPAVQWHVWGRRLPGTLLGPLLDDALRAVSGDVIARPIEKQYFLVWRDSQVRLITPHAQRGTAASLAYAMPERGVPLLDVHSHHAMRAYFSETDDRDDTGLSVSAVIGNLFQQPEITCRINVFGHRQIVPALTIFDDLGPFIEAPPRRPSCKP